MEKFTSHTGIGVPLQRSNVDTDQIIPAVYLKRITRTGFEDGLFASWRKDEDFILNQPEYKDGSVLVVGPDFGTGSSREHAVWALQNYGFKVVIGSRFGEIFRNNAGKAGLLIALVPQETVDALWEYIKLIQARRSASTCLAKPSPQARIATGLKLTSTPSTGCLMGLTISLSR